jgi:hypothetical protein
MKKTMKTTAKKSQKKDKQVETPVRKKNGVLTALDVEAGEKAIYLIKGTNTKIRILNNRNDDGTKSLNVYADGDHHSPGLIASSTELEELPPDQRHFDDPNKQKMHDFMRKAKKRKTESTVQHPSLKVDEKNLFTKIINDKGSWSWIMCSNEKKLYESKSSLMEAMKFVSLKFVKNSSVKNKKGTSYPTVVYEGLK